jgi:hypothetical protein
MKPFSVHDNLSVGYNDDHDFANVIRDICSLSWHRIDRCELFGIMQVYYYFSIQFRENLEIACKLFPEDQKLHSLLTEECHTDNLSPWPGISTANERLDHDEFIRRALILQPGYRSQELDELGRTYLAKVRYVDDLSRAKSIASYEDDGLSRVFTAILRSPDWQGSGLKAFKHFLEKHIEFDGNGEEGHGSLSRHLLADDSVLPLWGAFHELMLAAAPRLVPNGYTLASARARLANWFSPWQGAASRFPLTIKDKGRGTRAAKP